MIIDPLPYAARIKVENEAERQAILARRGKALEEAARLALLIRERDPEVRSVILFGSLAEGTPSHIDFDIDLALDGGDAYKAMDTTEESTFSVDVVELRLLPAHVRERVLSLGIKLS